jgi:hypothetical protein
MPKKEIKLDLKKLQVFKIRNRGGYAAVCQSNLTEGRTAAQAISRMLKAVARKPKKK